MSRPDHPWREDRLGRLLRAGLEETRRAAPSPAVWERVAAQAGPARRPRRPRAWPTTLHGATAVSGLLLAVLAISGLSAQLSLPPDAAQGAWLGAPINVELESNVMSRAIEPQALDRSMPPPRLDDRPAHRVGGYRTRVAREAYNRTEWLLPVPEPRPGPSSPLRGLVGH